MQLIRRQRGNALLSTTLSIALISFLMLQVVPMVSRYQAFTFRSATAANINEVAQAAKTRYMDQVFALDADCLTDRMNCWPTDMDELVTNNYVSARAEFNGYGLAIDLAPANPNITITSETPNAAEANSLALFFGGQATVENGTQVSINFAPPGIDPEHNALLDLDATRQVTGPVTFDLDQIIARTASSVVLDLAGGNLVDAGSIDANQTNVARANVTAQLQVQNADGTGSIIADAAEIETLTATQLQIDP